MNKRTEIRHNRGATVPVRMCAALLFTAVFALAVGSGCSPANQPGATRRTTGTVEQQTASQSTPDCCRPAVPRTPFGGPEGTLRSNQSHGGGRGVRSAGTRPTVSANHTGMVWIKPGRFEMGSPFSSFTDARPIHTVQLDGFWMDAAPVTNLQYAQFVRETGYITVAERKPDPAQFPGVPTEKLVPGSLVFRAPKRAVPLDDVTQWWEFVPGADWRHPEGLRSDLKGRENHPVVQVCFEDAAAFANWAGKRLPTEAEWEYAARGGLRQMPYVWGRTFRPGGKYMANTFQGHFPNANAKADGYARTSPVHAFPPNGYGLYDMAGNVWEWCSDWYRPDYYAVSPPKNPTGPSDSFDPAEPGIPKRVQRGGSFLCTDQYCSRYMPGGRGKGAVDTGASHVGFRCVLSADR